MPTRLPREQIRLHCSPRRTSASSGSSPAAIQSPPGFWYDQDRPEWVIVLAGSAAVRFEGETAPRTLRRGDYLHIPAHARHRVEWTDKDAPTIWIAVHYE